MKHPQTWTHDERGLVLDLDIYAYKYDERANISEVIQLYNNSLFIL